MSDRISTSEKVKLTVFTVREWPEVDRTYTHVLVRFPDDYEFLLSAADAQRLGTQLNRAGGGVA